MSSELYKVLLLIFGFLVFNGRMLRRCVVLLIVLGMIGLALACDILEPAPREIKVEVVEGLGGNCYYKRIPQPEQTQNWTREESWRTEFYLNKDATKAVFTKDTYFSNQIVCLNDESGTHISYVDRKNEGGLENKTWLEFFIDGHVIASYAPIDLLQRKDTVLRGEACFDLFTVYVKNGFGLKHDEDTNTYVYQVKTFDNHLYNFDLNTGKMIPTEQNIHTLLMDEVRNDHAEEVKKYLAQGANPNIGNIADGTPLHLATQLNRIEIVEILLEKGAKVNVKDFSEEEIRDPDLYDFSYIPHNPFFLAAKLGHLNITKMLLENGANINQEGPRYDEIFVDISISALEISILNNQSDIASYLLERGAEFNEETLDIAASKGNHQFVAYFLQQGISVTPSTLENAIESLDLETVKLVVNAGADLQSKCSLCFIADGLAQQDYRGTGIYELTKFLVHNGADPNFGDDWTPLIRAVAGNQPIFARALLELGADPNMASEHGTPLSIAKEEQLTEMLDLLIQYGAK